MDYIYYRQQKHTFLDVGCNKLALRQIAATENGKSKSARLKIISNNGFT
jgi:hypothetical protein